MEDGPSLIFSDVKSRSYSLCLLPFRENKRELQLDSSLYHRLSLTV